LADTSIPTFDELLRLVSVPRTDKTSADGYVDAVAFLRGLYDVLDYLKEWERTTPHPDNFESIKMSLNQEYDSLAEKVRAVDAEGRGRNARSWIHRLTAAFGGSRKGV
jgi:hypothetical protein